MQIFLILWCLHGSLAIPSAARATASQASNAAIHAATGRVFIETLNVTATASERRAIYLPYVVETLDRDSYALQQHRTLPEAMREMAGVMVQKTGHGQGSPFIRGFTGFPNVFLVDGIRHFGLRWRSQAANFWLELAATVADREDRLSSRDAGDTQRLPPGGTPSKSSGNWTRDRGFTGLSRQFQSPSEPRGDENVRSTVCARSSAIASERRRVRSLFALPAFGSVDWKRLRVAMFGSGRLGLRNTLH